MPGCGNPTRQKEKGILLCLYPHKKRAPKNNEKRESAKTKSQQIFSVEEQNLVKSTLRVPVARDSGNDFSFPVQSPFLKIIIKNEMNCNVKRPLLEQRKMFGARIKIM